MGFSFMTIEKVKSKKQLLNKFLHNYRCYNVDNADPELKDQNKEYIPMQGRNYLDKLNEKLYQQRAKGIKQTIRSDAVLALEVLCTYTNDETTKGIDIDTWAKNNIEWLNKTFNENGTDNVISCMLHMDEPGNAHLHAVIIPIDDKGHLNSFHYVKGPAEMRQLQSSYGEMMQERHGLERGMPKSVAKHSTIKKYLTRLNNPIGNELPDLFMGETAEAYFKRIQPIIEDSRLYHKRIETEYASKLKQISGNATQVPKSQFYTMLNGTVNLTSWKPRSGESAIDYRNRANILYENEILTCQNRIIKIKNEIDQIENSSLQIKIALAEKEAELERERKRLRKIIGGEDDYESVKKKYKKYKELDDALTYCPDKSLVNDTNRAIRKLKTKYREHALQEKGK